MLFEGNSIARGGDRHQPRPPFRRIRPDILDECLETDRFAFGQFAFEEAYGSGALGGFPSAQ